MHADRFGGGTGRGTWTDREGEGESEGVSWLLAALGIQKPALDLELEGHHYYHLSYS